MTASSDPVSAPEGRLDLQGALYVCESVRDGTLDAELDEDNDAVIDAARDGAAALRAVLATPPAPEVTEEMVSAAAMQMARHFAEKIPLTRHDDAALARMRDTFLGEARRILVAALRATRREP